MKPQIVVPADMRSADPVFACMSFTAGHIVIPDALFDSNRLQTWMEWSIPSPMVSVVIIIGRTFQFIPSTAIEPTTHEPSSLTGRMTSRD